MDKSLRLHERPHYIKLGASDSHEMPISILVTDSVGKTPDRHYKTVVATGGILLGAMKRLLFTHEDTNPSFKFTFMDDQNYGPYLNSVNNLFEDRDNNMYWELKVKKPDGKIITPCVGIGCYTPEKDDEIIFNYFQYKPE